jgi:hypothetical protein
VRLLVLYQVSFLNDVGGFSQNIAIESVCSI